MNFTRIIIAVVGVVALVISSRAPASPTTQPTSQPASFHKTITKSIGYDCLVYLPAGYGQSDKKFPLLIFLHGSGECGNDLGKTSHAGPGHVMMMNDVPHLPFVVIVPQSPSELDWFEVESLNLV